MNKKPQLKKAKIQRKANTLVALYDKPQSLPLPDMYGKNLFFTTKRY